MIRLKVHFGEDSIFALVVPSTVSHPELIDKVGRKLRSCGCNVDTLRLRCASGAARGRADRADIDEDQDRVVLRDEDDINLAVSMALNAPRDPSQPPTLTLIAT